MRFITKTNWILILVVLAVGALAIGTVSSVSSCCGDPDPPIAFQRPVFQQPIVYAPAPVVPVTVARPAPCRSCAAPVVVSRPAPVTITRPAPCSSCSVPVVASRPVVNSCSACSVPVTVSRPAFRTVRETVMKEEEVTTYETVWEEETRYRTKTVCKQVPETTIKKETYQVSKPVWETIEKETSYDVVRYVPETSEREEVSTVCKPVTEYQERQIVETVNRPVQETVMQQRTYLVNRPVTTTQTQIRDVGEYVTHYTPRCGKEYTRLTWQKGGEYYDPATGETKRRLPGLYWTDLTGPTEYKAERVYQQKLVSEVVPVTTMVSETVTENVPVTVNKTIQEQVVRTEQVPVTKMVEERVVNKIPVTTYKPVTEKVVQKTPVKVCRMVTEEQVREIPVTTYKTVTETIQEPYTVKIARRVPKTVKVQRPVTVCRQVPIDPCPASTEAPAKLESTPETAPQSTPSDSSDASSIPTLKETGSQETSETTSKYPEVKVNEEEVVTTDDEPSELPAVPFSQKEEKVASGTPSTNETAVKSPEKAPETTTVTESKEDVLPSPIFSAPPAPTDPEKEADKVPMLKEEPKGTSNESNGKEADQNREDKNVSRTSDSSKGTAINGETTVVQRPVIDSAPAKLAEGSEKNESETREKASPVEFTPKNPERVLVADNYFGYSDGGAVVSDSTDYQPVVPNISPTRMLKQ